MRGFIIKREMLIGDVSRIVITVQITASVCYIVFLPQLIGRIVLIYNGVCAIGNGCDISVIVIAIAIGNGITACGGLVGSDLAAGGFGIGGGKVSTDPPSLSVNNELADRTLRGVRKTYTP